MPGREGIVITLEGDHQLVVTLKEASDEVGDYSSTNAAAAEMIINAARPITPVDTGYLQEQTTADTDELQATVLNPLDYAPVIHNGWPAHHIAATPFLEGGWLLSIDRWSPLYIERLKEIVGEIEGA